jgi:hypothetical protein
MEIRVNMLLPRILVPATAIMALLVASLANAEPRTYTQRVQFPKGATSTVLSGSLAPGEARNYLVGARDLQMMTVRLMPGSSGAGLHFNVLVPGGSMLFESVKAGANANQYKGQLYKNGDHTVTVYNTGSAKASYQLSVAVESMAAAAPAAKAQGTPSRQEQACLAAVSREANNGEVTVLSSEFSQANSLVMIGVGSQKAPWRCLVSNSGVVAEVSFAGSEGAL